ncbi:MAG: Crp/Fnr family transcriptional regulator [Gammaproteobacteria bacterium]|jgi:CRP/FNR family transcriptional regulator|nr:Crp/Fnr family transcriptional regulator [Gammaproteobacteria bacterium]MBT4194628.1 Crp/Fnr family transcriptional regulator [Gammaproteobacteria bacterium]MBT6701264.1 Crp/Fnr family transcriptional regulator [Gammaproteobacteria bacterium]
MISSVQQAEFEKLFPFIKQAQPDFVETFYAEAQYMEIPAGVSICDEGQQCSHLAMILDGVGRVYKLSPSGREVTLYRIYGGESCVLTASCIMNQDNFPAMAITETPVRVLLISPVNVRQWFCKDSQWQQFIFSLLSHRLSSIISVVEEVAFKRIDVRLAEQFARELAKGVQVMHKTHADLAADVGSSREVVSRTLRDMAHRGLVVSSRGNIEIINKEAVIELSKQ